MIEVTAAMREALNALGPTEQDIAQWEIDHAKARDLKIRAIDERFRPWRRYLMPETGQIVQVDGVYADGTLRVWVDDKFNDPRSARTGVQVMGVDPDELVSWPPLK